MATCSISGQVPEEPVVSLKSGHLFEKRLILKHIEACGLCPITQMPLTKDDLLPVKTSSSVVRPRPPTATSFPALLQMLQSEWDSMALETFTMRQKMNALKQELAHAAYEQDAAKRVIARLIAERDSALEQLKNVDANVARAVESAYKAAPAAAESKAADTTSVAASTDSMTDGSRTKGIPSDVISRMEAGQAKVGGANRTSTVKQRQAFVQSQEQLSALAAAVETAKLDDIATSFAVGGLTDATPGSLAFIGTQSGAVVVYTMQASKLTFVGKVQVGTGAVTYLATHPGASGIAFAGTSEGVVRAINASNAADVASGATNELSFELSQPMRAGSDAGAVTALAVHPAGDVALAAFNNGSWAVFDAVGSACVAHIPPAADVAGTVRLALHPDGNLVGIVSSKAGKLNIYETASQALLCTIDVCSSVEGAGVQAIAFSENGLSCYTADSTGSIKLWQLRKPDQPPKAIGKLEEGTLGSLSVDLSGTYVIATTNNTFSVYTAKTLAPVVTKTTSGPKHAVTFATIGSEARSIVAVTNNTAELFTC